MTDLPCLIVLPVLFTGVLYWMSGKIISIYICKDSLYHVKEIRTRPKVVAGLCYIIVLSVLCTVILQ
jgi:hypothetical protein